MKNPIYRRGVRAGTHHLDEPGVERTVKIKNLRSPQHAVNEKKVNALARFTKNMPGTPTVSHLGGGVHVLKDGNHRVAAAIKQGKRVVKVRVQRMASMERPLHFGISDTADSPPRTDIKPRLIPLRKKKIQFGIGQVIRNQPKTAIGAGVFAGIGIGAAGAKASDELHKHSWNDHQPERGARSPEEIAAHYKKIYPTAYLSGSSALKIGIPGSSDVDVHIPTRSVASFKRVESKLLKTLSPSAYYKPGYDHAGFTGKMDGRPIDVAVTYGEKGFKKRDAIRRVASTMTDGERSQIIETKKKLKSAWIAPEARYHAYKRGLDLKHGIPLWRAEKLPEQQMGSRTRLIRFDDDLQPHQKRVIARLRHPNTTGLVVAHGLGSGKTRTAIEAHKALGGEADVVLPAALRANYQKETEKWGGPEANVMSQQALSLKGRGALKSPLLIVDEAHRARNPRAKLSEAIKGSPASKRLLLTGTPSYNNPADLATLVNQAAGKPVLREGKAFQSRYLKPGMIDRWRGKRLSNSGELKKVLNKYVDYHKGDPSMLPEVKSRTIPVEMGKHQSELYRASQGKIPPGLKVHTENIERLAPYLTGARQVSNTSSALNARSHEEPKLDKAFADLQEHLKSPKGKALIYSNWLKHGIEPMQRRLTEANVPHGTFTGNEPMKQRTQTVKDYNEGRHRALLVSSSGAEGLDLKGTRMVQILEPHFNNAKIRQVVGRSARMGSHSHLPPEDRNVEVRQYLARPRNRILPGSSKGVEDMLAEAARRKDETDRQITALLSSKVRPIQFGYLGAGKPGWKRPLILNGDPSALGHDDAVAVFHPPTRAAGMSKEAMRNHLAPASPTRANLRTVTKGGYIVTPTSRELSGHGLGGGIERIAVGGVKGAQKVNMRHELIHALREPANYAKNSKEMKRLATTPESGVLREELAAYTGSMFGKRSKGLGPLGARLRLLAGKMTSYAGMPSLAKRIVSKRFGLDSRMKLIHFDRPLEEGVIQGHRVKQGYKITQKRASNLLRGSQWGTDPELRRVRKAIQSKADPKFVTYKKGKRIATSRVVEAGNDATGTPRQHIIEPAHSGRPERHRGVNSATLPGILPKYPQGDFKKGEAYEKASKATKHQELPPFKEGFGHYASDWRDTETFHKARLPVIKARVEELKAKGAKVPSGTVKQKARAAKAGETDLLSEEFRKESTKLSQTPEQLREAMGKPRQALAKELGTRKEIAQQYNRRYVGGKAKPLTNWSGKAADIAIPSKTLNKAMENLDTLVPQVQKNWASRKDRYIGALRKRAEKNLPGPSLPTLTGGMNAKIRSVIEPIERPPAPKGGLSTLQPSEIKQASKDTAAQAVWGNRTQDPTTLRKKFEKTQERLGRLSSPAGEQSERIIKRRLIRSGEVFRDTPKQAPEIPRFNPMTKKRGTLIGTGIAAGVIGAGLLARKLTKKPEERKQLMSSRLIPIRFGYKATPYAEHLLRMRTIKKPTLALPWNGAAKIADPGMERNLRVRARRAAESKIPHLEAGGPKPFDPQHGHAMATSSDYESNVIRAARSELEGKARSAGGVTYPEAVRHADVEKLAVAKAAKATREASRVKSAAEAEMAQQAAEHQSARASYEQQANSQADQKIKGIQSGVRRKVAIGVGAGASLGAIGGWRARKPEETTQFRANMTPIRFDVTPLQNLRNKANPPKEHGAAHDMITGGIEGSVGGMALLPIEHRVVEGRWMNPLLHNGAFNKGVLAKRLIAGGLIGAAATGAIGAGVSAVTRKKQEQRPIQFQLIAPNRGAVTRDRYTKQIHEREQERKESNLLRSGIVGAGIGGLLRGKKGAMIGAGAGLAGQAVIHQATNEKDQFGEESYAARRVQKLPWEIGGVAALGILGKRAVGNVKSLRSKIPLSARSKLIQFKSFEHKWLGGVNDKGEEIQVNRGRRAEDLRTYYKRTTGALRDVGGVLKGEKPTDERGRPRKQEWEKPYAKKWLAGAILAGGLGVAAKIHRSPAGFAQGTAAHALIERVQSGAAKTALKKQFPKTVGAAEWAGGKVKTFKQNLADQLGAAAGGEDKSLAGRAVKWIDSKLGKEGASEVSKVVPGPGFKPVEAGPEELRKIAEKNKATEALKNQSEKSKKTLLSSRARIIRLGEDTEYTDKWEHWVRNRPGVIKRNREKKSWLKRSENQPLIQAGLVSGTAIGTAYATRKFAPEAFRMAKALSSRDPILTLSAKLDLLLTPQL